MKIKNKKYYKKTLKVNEKNNLDSIIELFQKFGNKYNIITTTLEPNIQYQTKDRKITQTYTKTILEKNMTQMTEQLKKEGKITLIIIDNTGKKNKKLKNKIKQLNNIKNVETKVIKKKDTFKTLDEIVSRGVK